MDSAEDPFIAVRQALGRFQGRGFEQLNLSINETLDALEITLAQYEPDNGISLSIRTIHYFAIHRLPGDGIDLVDFHLMTLDPYQPWPSGLPKKFTTADTAPPLLWLHGEGAVSFDVVAASVTVLGQVGEKSRSSA